MKRRPGLIPRGRPISRREFLRQGLLSSGRFRIREHGLPAAREGLLLRGMGAVGRKQRLFFVGAPLNMKDGDGMMVRPVVFVY